MDFTSSYLSEEAFSAAIDHAVEGLDIVPLEKDLPQERPIAQLRRERGAEAFDNVGLLTLVEENGLLHWEETRSILPPALKGRRAFWGGKRVLKQLKYEKLGFSEVAGYLETFDKKLTPYWGLRRWNGSYLRPCMRPTGERPILLFVHGTFSRNEAIFEQLGRTSYGQAFLRKMQEKYEILAFDHPTLSVSPMINALDLARVLGNHPQPVDVICHSRGGLVTRWWLETFDSGRHGSRRAILVGAPLAGTSLAAPDKLRHGIDLLTHLGRLVGEGLSLIPYLTVAGGLLKVVCSFGSIVANTPVVDVAVAAIPGLAAMSRVTNNFELSRLNSVIPGTVAPKYFAVASNFEPSTEEWEFWRHFADFKTRVAHVVSDRLIFEAENDLIVDTESMFQLAGSLISETEGERVCRFQNSTTVYHTNYFLQQQTIEFIEKTLLASDARS